MGDGDGLEIDLSHNDDIPAADQKNLFEVFKLSETVRNLSIRSYGGAAFPNWLGNPSSMKNITSLLLSDCSYCELLPPLGQLSSLQHLVLENFSVIAIVGHEFFRSDVTHCRPFQSLKTLKFERIPEWEDWELLEEEEAGVPLPCLQQLYLINCPKLEGDLPKFLPSLVKLVISDCPQLAASVPRTPPRCLVTLQNCDKVPNRGDYVQMVSTQLSQHDPQTNPTSSEVQDQEQSRDDTPTNPPSSDVRDQQQDQDRTQTQPPSSNVGNQQQASSEDGNQQFSPSMELPTDVCSMRIERYAWNMLPKEISERSSLQQLFISH